MVTQSQHGLLIACRLKALIHSLQVAYPSTQCSVAKGLKRSMIFGVAQNKQSINIYIFS